MRGGQETLAQRVLSRVAGRIPVICAGGVLTPEQARRVLGTGLSAAVVGRGLVMNPDWVELAVSGREDRIRTSVDMDRSAAELGIPSWMRETIADTPGWFPISSGEEAPLCQ